MCHAVCDWFQVILSMCAHEIHMSYRWNVPGVLQSSELLEKLCLFLVVGSALFDWQHRHLTGCVGASIHSCLR